jgi:Tfp pilus assembly protein PilO
MYKRILAAAIIILIAFAYVQWGMDYIYAYEWGKTAPDRESLVNEIENTKKIVNQPVNSDPTLSQKLVELQGQVNLEKEKFPADIYVTDVVDELLHLAQDAGIGIIPLRNGDWSKAKEKGYEQYEIQLIVAGDIDDITGFVDQVESRMLYSINVESLEMSGESIVANAAAVADNTTVPDTGDDIVVPGAVEGYVTVTVYRRA